MKTRTLGKSGLSVARLLLRHGYEVYASDGAKASESADVLRATCATLPLRFDVGKHDLALIRGSALVVGKETKSPDHRFLSIIRGEKPG